MSKDKWEGEFSVYQWLGEEQIQERVRTFVGAEEAVQAFRHYTTNVASRMGLTQRVIITDGGDFTCMEWIQGKGVTFPPPVPEGVTVVDLNDPQKVHNAIAEAIGESVAKKPHET